jgi:hypothetical protein
VHKLQEGELDGLTMMFTSGMTEWAKLSDIPEMKKVAQSIAEEESRASELLSSIGTDDQTFSSEMYKDEMMPAPEGVSTATPVEEEEEGVKEFINDEGVRHVWDANTSDWVVAEEEGGVTEGEKGGEITGPGGGGGSKETSQFLKDLDEGKGKGDATVDHKPEKRKRNKKKKKSSSDWNATSSLWVYVNHLPGDITMEEVKAHFSKVSLLVPWPAMCASCQCVLTCE